MRMKPIALWRRRNMDVIKVSEDGDNVGVGTGAYPL
jgi:hypothetical protein